MARPVNTFASNDMVGIREDLADFIDNVDPEETPAYTMMKKVRASNTLHEWQTDTLRASADNEHIEGDDTIATAAVATVRLGNYTQNFKEAVTVSDGDQGLTKAGRAAEMAYQIMKKTAELKLDIERAIYLNRAKRAGTAVLAPRMAGIPTWITTNAIFESGASGANPTGDGSDTRTDDGTPVAFSQARFDSAMQSAWENGGKPTKVLLSAYQMDVAQGFVGNNAQRTTVAAGRGGMAVNAFTSVYVTPWGTVEFVPIREGRSRDVLILQPDKWNIAIKRPLNTKPLAKTGDSEKRQLLTELTLVSRNQKASAAVYDNTVA